MDPTSATGSLHVTPQEVLAFAEATGDRSPLHLDADYARRTPFGEPVAHGLLCLLKVLTRARVPQGRRLAGLRSRFAAPVLPGQDYRCTVRENVSDDGDARVDFQVLDGDRTVIEGQATFTGGEVRPAPARAARPRTAARATVAAFENISPGDLAGGDYRPDWKALEVLVSGLQLPDHGVGVEHAAVLGWASHVAGMEVPGRAAMISGLDLVFLEAPKPRGFRGQVEVTDLDDRFRTVRLTGEASAGRTAAEVELRVVVRREAAAPSTEDVRREVADLIDERRLAGRSALVTGGSRGLGAALVQGLAVAGCTVHAMFRESRTEAEALVAALGPDGERVRLHQGDAADADWCLRTRRAIESEYGPVDYVFLNAGPAANALGLHPATAARARDHVSNGMELAQAPLSAFAEGLAHRQGRVIAVSSSYVTSPRRGFGHYVAAKSAWEGLVRASAVECPGLGVSIIRPPRLATTFADSVTGAEEALSVEPVAGAILRHVAGCAPGSVEVLEEFTCVGPSPAGAPGPDASAENRTDGLLVVAATFTTDPLRPVLSHWVERLGLDLDVHLASYNQVFQELLDPRSSFASNRRGCNVALIRLEDWPSGAAGRRTVEEFGEAASVAAARGAVPLVVALCPSSPGARALRGPELAEWEDRLSAVLGDAAGLHLIPSAEWSGAYPVVDHHDAAREEHAHIPYTPAAWTVLGTAVVRTVHALVCPPYKVLVLDCDNTLWSGVCGEDGARGITIGPSRRRLQEWALTQHDNGVLICLASKNEEEDVDAVFRQRDDLLLRPEHITARRVNWDPKPDNLRELARELGLGLDSMVFLDDNPVETAAVRAACPGVLALTLPADEEDLPGFLDRLWAFDRGQVTDEDRRRGAMYREGKGRETLRASTTTLAEFVAGLELRIDVHEARPDELARVAQLTQRTNQFNLSTVRRSEPALRELLDAGARCRVVEVSDRFGEYGLVGAAITRPGAQVVNLDTFLLSCRVLGRGVEHAFLAAVAAEEAGEGKATTLEAVQRPTAKNRPARMFFDQAMGAGTSRPGAVDGEIVHRADLGVLTGLTFRPDDGADTGVASPAPDAAPADAPHGTADAQRIAALTTLAVDLTDSAALHRSVTGDPDVITGPAPLRSRKSAHATFDAVRDVLSALLHIPRSQLRRDSTMESLRLESLQIVDATVALEKRFGRLSGTLFFEHRTLGALADAIAPAHAAHRPPADAGHSGVRVPAATTLPQDTDAIAVVGIAGRYPGAEDITQLWDNLVRGADSLGDIAERWDRLGAAAAHPAADDRRTSGGLIDGVDAFDSLFFSIAPSEAATMDPQQRLFLQTAYHALEDAGHTTRTLGRNVSVHVASMGPDYAVLNADAALRGGSRYPNSDLYQLANRVSYFFDFTGPSIAVDTACSGSGVALKLACDTLRSGSASAAIAGGVNLILHPARRLQYTELGMISPTGRCRPFGEGADGMVTSEGVGAVLLRPLSAALADGDHIYGVIRSVETNSGGRTGGFTVPSPDAQAALIGSALRRADVDPATIGYVEAHGTGTPLGDPIEIRGLTTAFGTELPQASIPIGSIKGNIGHTEATAAVAGLTKTLLQFEHRTLVPSLHAAAPNPAIDFAATPFHVQQTVADWSTGRHGGPRRAALSSFGAGGVNVHMILEEPPSPRRSDDPPHPGSDLLILSAPDEERLRLMARRLGSWARATGRRTFLADITHTLRVGRAEFDARLAVPVSGHQAFAECLDRLADPATDLAEAVDEAGGSLGRVTPGQSLADVFDGSPEMTEVLRGLADRGDLAALGRLWCQGAAVDWQALLGAEDRRRVPLPGFPFRRTRHWLPRAEPTAGRRPAEPSDEAAAVTYYAPHWAPESGGPTPARTGQHVIVLGADGPWAREADGRIADASDLLSHTTEPGTSLVVVDRRGLDAAGSEIPAELPREIETLRGLARMADDGHHVTYVCVDRPGRRAPGSALVPGFGRALAQESPHIRTLRVEVSATAQPPTLPAVLDEVSRGTTEVLYDGERRVRRWQRVAPAATAEAPFAVGGHYLITGGDGGIARLLTEHLTTRFGASVTLLARTEARPGTDGPRHAAAAGSGRVLRLRADVCDARSLERALRAAREQHGPVRGVIHAAGVLRDGAVRDTTDEATSAVLAPKVRGAWLLDEATSADELDFFLVMSSFVGTFGNRGQAAYCAANRYLDAFAEHRAARAVRGERHGRSISAIWPLWEQGGMEMPPAVRQLTAVTVGLEPIDTPTALAAFEDVVRLGAPVVLIGRGTPDRVTAALAALEPAPDAVGPAAPEQAGDAPDRDVLRGWLRSEAAALAGVPAEQVDTAADFGAYGFNSVMFTDFANRINARFRLVLTPVVFYEAPTIDALARELTRRHGTSSFTADHEQTASRATPDVTSPHTSSRTPSPNDDRPFSPAVAVIGMAGRFPGASDLDAYWSHLLAGRNLVGRAAAGRFGELRPVGGFLDRVLAFDAGFFGVSPREARLMDPQQRLFLEEAWHAIEDAGTAPRSLAGSRTGVFVGATLSDYADLLNRSAEDVAAHSVTGHVQSIIANRLSYLLDLRGPSEVVDTACSSSLTALHRALNALAAGECDLAVAGGVNVLFSPQWFTSLDAAGMLSASGRCWAFDERADGFVRGEGVGVVVLKPLDAALRDGDEIRAVIKGSAVNHGGRAHSLTAPNPEAQADVVATALKRAGLAPRSVSYVETHGTGTKLGDPIEAAGLTKAFGGLVAAPWCHLGAVKGNLGHLESAAGMAGLLKVLLALRHRTLPPNAVGDRPNPHLRLADGPFEVLTEPRAWRPADDSGRPLPLRAGVSAFGFGGANAHVVVEEPPKRHAPEADRPATVRDQGGHLVVLSATDPGRLREYARLLRDSVERANVPLADLAYTSRVARDALPVRLAAAAVDHDHLVTLLDAYRAGEDADGLYTGDSAPEAVQPRGVRREAVAWVTGADIDRTPDPARRRVPFPLYPFDHTTEHGPMAEADPDGRPAAPSEHTDNPLAAPVPQLLARRWIPQPVAAPETDARRPSCVLVIGRDAEASFAETLAGYDATHWIVVREPSRLPALSAYQYEMEFDDHGAGQRAAADILASHPGPYCLIDLVDATGGMAPDRENARLGLLKGLLDDGRTAELRLVHLRRTAGSVTGEGQPDAGVGGARLAGLVRAVGAEYSAVRAVTVESDGGDLAAGLDRALRELGTAVHESEVRWRAGVREVARFSRVAPEAAVRPGALGAFPLSAERPYLITGGTGGLGLAAAELLVARGARKLVLTGRRELPPRHRWSETPENAWWADRVAALRRLEAAGADIMLHSGPLSDGTETARLLADVRQRMGRPAGVLHCAGSLAPTPAFVRKPLDEILSCWEPKGSGLAELDRALTEDEPDFVALYSSLSAAVPALGAGLSDYAGANAALDAYAGYASRRAAARGSRTHWVSIGWGSWSGRGMGEVTGPRYRGLGLSAMTPEQGLGLLDAALSVTGHPQLLAVVAVPDTARTLHRPGPVDALSRLPGTTTTEPDLPVPGTPAGTSGRDDLDELKAACAAHITEVLATTLLLDRERIRPDSGFADLGVDSILIAGIVRALEPLAGAPLEPSVVLEHPSVSRLAEHLCLSHPEGVARWAGRDGTESAPDPVLPAPATPSSTATAMPLAVIGMAGRFPGAPDTQRFWDLLRRGGSGVTEVPRSRWDVATLYAPEHAEGRSISKWGGFLDGIEEFDADYFGVPREHAAHMDPLTRLFLEVAEQTFADAGYRGEELAAGRVGVFVGSGTSSYGSRIAVPHRATATGLNPNFIGAHLAHFRDLRGPNLVVDTACSSSLTSLHLARQALQLGECETALVGGADLILDESPYLSLSAARALSPNGVCRVFDARADGFVPGEGVGAVLLKPLDRALADGDRIHGVIEATAMNNDGRTMGLTTPNPQAQQAVVRDALRQAGTDASTLSYVEAHGTGTMIGDPIELKALTGVFDEATAERGFCAVGSVKSNVGHLLMAAGMAGLHKVLLSLRNEALPPTLHCEHPNPRFAFEASPFRLQRELQPWVPRNGIRRAGISAFGFGGTNCHVVLRGLTDSERASRTIPRSPLPAPAFRRTRHWIERSATPVPLPVDGPRPLLQLEELI
ncbi:SDR family NAD(P)-dependent oxidoreductase [Streptomyces anulatus]|uniref:SDR family NAD(P)-dependent oxidoreductase n=1 Tax=Streptomyces anulatus TaxID=1892 RepID=UPI003408A280